MTFPTDHNYSHLPASERPRCYAYARFSSDQQEQGDSLNRQATLAERWASARGMELDAELSVQDLGISAFRQKNMAEGGGLRRFIDAIEEGMVAPASYFLVESVDRITRNTPRKGTRLLEQIVEAGVNVVTLVDGKVYTLEELDRDPMAFLYAYIIAIRAQDESKAKSERSRANWTAKRAAAERGEKVTSITPAWLQLAADRETVEVIEEKAEVVREVFRLALQGMGPQAIAGQLNAAGVPPLTEGDVRRSTGRWHRSYVHSLLRNRAVLGEFQPTRSEYVRPKGAAKDAAPSMRRKVKLDAIPGYYPAVVDQQTFDDVQALSSGRIAKASSAVIWNGDKAAVRNIFAGLGVCPLCGSSMMRINKGTYRNGKPKPAYLLCSGAHAKSGCRYQLVRYDACEAALIEHAGWLREHAPSRDANLDAELADGRFQLEELGKEIARVVQAIVAAGTSDALTSKLRELEASKVETAAKVKELEGRLAGAVGIVLQTRLEKLEDALTSGDMGQANAAMRMLLTSVTIDYRTGELVLAWKHDGTTSITYTMEPAAPGEVAEARKGREESIKRAARETVTKVATKRVKGAEE